MIKDKYKQLCLFLKFGGIRIYPNVMSHSKKHLNK